MREAENPALSDNARAKKKEEAIAKQEVAIEAERNLSETVQGLQRRLTEDEVRMLRRTSKEIQSAVAAYAREKGIQMVLQYSAAEGAGPSSVFYADETLDITAAIMQLIGIQPAPATEATVGGEQG